MSGRRNSSYKLALDYEPSTVLLERIQEEVSKEISSANDFLLYINAEGGVKVDVLLRDETIWLTVNQMAELFGIDRSGGSRHIKNIFDTGELQEEVVCAKIALTTQHGTIAGKTQTNFNLDVIISVGYRVNSIRGTHFRIWATQQLKELIVKGFVLKKGKTQKPRQSFRERLL